MQDISLTIPNDIVDSIQTRFANKDCATVLTYMAELIASPDLSMKDILDILESEIDIQNGNYTHLPKASDLQKYA